MSLEQAIDSLALTATSIADELIAVRAKNRLLMQTCEMLYGLVNEEYKSLSAAASHATGYSSAQESADRHAKALNMADRVLMEVSR